MAGEVAALLKQRREEQGVSFEEAHSQTNIPERYLHILEGQGDPRVLADTLYLIPFLRIYATFLELDPAETVARFLADIQKNPYLEGAPAQTTAGSFSRPVVIGVLLLALLVLGVYVFKDSLPWLESLGNSPGSR